MALTPGTHLGVFQLIDLIGRGGMGEVYRATDTSLGRQVAIKVLPEAFAQDAERLARFEREAKTLASLNHPNIAAIYAVERSGGVTALVMELVEGDDLSQRIARGALAIDEALPIAKQIAEALEAAHEQGIIHRDLKPANIKVRPDGAVKVLDFGLAKAMEPTAGSSPSMSMSPTITTPALMTGAGMILGTAAYMSPEQARGKTVDKRADIWAFGAVLFEMLTGKRAFGGEDVQDTFVAIMRDEPDWSRLPATLSPALGTFIQRCLQKDPRHRIHDIADVRLALEGAFDTVAGHTGSHGQDPTFVRTQVDAAVATARRDVTHAMRRRAALIGAAALVIGGAGVGAAVWWATRPAAPTVVRLTVTTSGPTALTLGGDDGGGRDVVMTPDGSRIVYRGNNQLLVRALDQFEPTVLSGLGAPRSVFISPDGQWVGFFDGAAMKKVAVTGGPPVTVFAGAGNPRGATWSTDGTIIFATTALATGLQRVSAGGGDPTVLTTPDRERGEGDHVWPEFLPDGQAVLFTVTPVGLDLGNAQIAVLDLRTGTSKVLIRGGSHARYVPTGHLVYGVAGTLRAVPFDLARLEVMGTPAPVLEGVVTTAQGAADIAVAANGSLVYVPGTAGGGGRLTIVSADRQGRASPLPGIPPDTYRDVRVSPDGARLALATATDVWTYDVMRATLSRLTTDTALDTSPFWTPDGQRIIFTSNRAGNRELFSRAADGTGSDERLLARAKDLLDLRGSGWSADGRQFLFTEVSATVQCAIGQIAIERPSEAKVLVKSEFCDDFASVSPDGRWMAYESNVSGQYEIYVERYPALGNRQQISTGGGRIPVWSRDGRELYFGSLDSRQMLAVSVQSWATLVAGRSQVLFEFAMLPSIAGQRPYDLGPDGRFFLIRSAQEATGGAPAANLIVVQHWFEELKRLVPTK